jgi:cation diffusion facilitator CzcD-associated flavoprotein CzcO
MLGIAFDVKQRSLKLTTIALEAAPSVGGTWYHNRYPGARVDFQSLEYSFSFSEELQQEWNWSEKFAGQEELLRYANHVADRFELRKNIRFNTRVIAASWNEISSEWEVLSEAGERWSARFLVLATGPLSVAAKPDFVGINQYQGELFHTSNWPLDGVNLKSKRVGVVGTGSTGVQLIPQVAEQATHLTVFQRTAAYVVPSRNRMSDPDHVARIKSDYRGFRERNKKYLGGYGSEFPPIGDSIFSVSLEERHRRFEEAWSYGGFLFGRTFADLLTSQEAGDIAAEFIRCKIREIVKDSETCRKLEPHHAFWCKRLCIDSADYYGTYNLPHVSLVDVNATPIERVVPMGIVAGGEEHKLDVLIFATGFDALTGSIKSIDLRGREGARIEDLWQYGPSNYLGLAVNRMPNMFFIAGPGSATAFTNVIVSIEHHVDWIASLLSWMRSNGYMTGEADSEAELKWMETVQQFAEKTTRLSCNSWYLGSNVPGKPRKFMPYSGGLPLYVKACADVAESGYRGFQFAN